MNPLETDLMELDIDQLEPTEVQPRKLFNETKLNELAESIKTNGVIQPIVARRSGERFQIIAGERRWRAAQLAGLRKVPCIIKDIAEENVLEISLIENIQREDLNPIEEANAYKNLLESLEVTQEEVARRVGKDRSSITNTLRLLRLPVEVQKLVEEDKLSMGHARALLSLDSSESQTSLAFEIISRTLSVRETEKLVKKKQNVVGSDTTRETVISENQGEDANIVAAEMKLSKRLAAPVKIKLSKEGGTIEVKFSSNEDLSRLFDLLIQNQKSDPY